jgi:ankyrin repeat protein
LGRLDRLKELVLARPELVHARGGDGQLPLHFAASVPIAEFLLANGASIDARDIDHESTAAQYMVRDRPEVARYLVSRGCSTDLLLLAALGDLEGVRRLIDADPSLVRMHVSERYFPKRNPHSGGCIYIWTLGQNKTAHAVAREFGHEAVFQLLMERSPAALQLTQAGEAGDELLVKKLLAEKPDLVKELTDEDCASLVHAAQKSDTRAARMMLEAGWPVDVRGQHGGTALHWAAWHGNAELVELLLRFKASTLIHDPQFQATALGWAKHGAENSWLRHTGDYSKVISVLERTTSEAGRVSGT